MLLQENSYLYIIYIYILEFISWQPIALEGIHVFLPLGYICHQLCGLDSERSIEECGELPELIQ